jgi:hypothetical protein
LIKIEKGWAINSVVECYFHTVEVAGSNPASPTTLFSNNFPLAL